ncbi:site-specific integrase [Streptomyces nigrescens]|uniref:site-specific integrase n=1 Tax=Streptomyces nigrescens TaxID=1920 RepID=UPI00346D520E
MTTAVTVWEDFDVPPHAPGDQVTLNLYDHLAAYAPKRPGAYLRISSDRFGLEAGVDHQLEDAEDSRTPLRWGPFMSATGLTNADGEALTFSPHDFRRIFVTDAIMNGLPRTFAQVICGHKSIDTTIGYKAVYPAASIEAHRAFIARRRPARPPQRGVPDPD